MAKYSFPAVFTPEECGYSVCFPDIECAVTCGETYEEALEMARDVLPLMLLDMEESGQAIPQPTDMGDVTVKPGEVVAMIHADTEAYKERLGRTD